MTEYEWDEDKRQRNFEKHGVDFEQAEQLDWETALTLEDSRNEYGERRYVTAGMIAERLHVAVWTPRGGVIRLISLRKANEREVKAYEQA